MTSHMREVNTVLWGGVGWGGEGWTECGGYRCRKGLRGAGRSMSKGGCGLQNTQVAGVAGLVKVNAGQVIKAGGQSQRALTSVLRH